jgi:colanic acid/amylovoran biosynthesis glycosyltransferase
MSKLVVASYCTTFLKSEMLHIYRQVTGLRGVRTFVMTKKKQNTELFPFDDIELIPAPRPNPFRHGWLKFVERQPPIVYRGEYQLLANLLERRGADLMHIYFGHTGVHLLPFIQCWDKPCIVSFHGADVMLKAENPDYAIKLRRVFEAVPLVLARSRSLERRLITLGCPPEKIRINRTGIPLAKFPMMRREAPRDGRWRFLQACRLIPKKGLTTCLKAFAIFYRNNPGAELMIAGKGPLQPALEALAMQLGVSDRVHFTGFLSQENLLKLYHSCHIFLHPSEMPADENQEGIPNSILEAMATGMPVLATKHGGIPEAVESGRCGALVEERDHEALAAEMAKVTRSPNFFSEMGVLASESVTANFEQSAHISALESNYREAVEIAAEEMEARVGGAARVMAAPFQQEEVPAK